MIFSLFGFCFKMFFPGNNPSRIYIIEFISLTDLFVPNHRLESAKKEAETLPSVELNFIDLQWLQVGFHSRVGVGLNILSVDGVYF
jgi:hypothetical protein